MNGSKLTVAPVIFGITTLLALISEAAAAGGLPSGAYDCGGGYTFRHFGTVDISGDQFRYRPGDQAHGGFAPYSVDASGAIAWGGPFPGFDNILASTRESWGFNVKYQGGQLVGTMSCHGPR